MITRLKLSLEQAEYLALVKIAENELRNPIDQARFILRQELERRGLLVIGTSADSKNESAVFDSLADKPKTVGKR